VNLNILSRGPRNYQVQSQLAIYSVYFESGTAFLSGPGINEEHDLSSFPSSENRPAIAAYLVAALESNHYGE